MRRPMGETELQMETLGYNDEYDICNGQTEWVTSGKSCTVYTSMKQHNYIDYDCGMKQIEITLDHFTET